jgi:hypothetical protein
LKSSMYSQKISTRLTGLSSTTGFKFSM